MKKTNWTITLNENEIVSCANKKGGKDTIVVVSAKNVMN